MLRSGPKTRISSAQVLLPGPATESRCILGIYRLILCGSLYHYRANRTSAAVWLRTQVSLFRLIDHGLFFWPAGVRDDFLVDAVFPVMIPSGLGHVPMPEEAHGHGRTGAIPQRPLRGFPARLPLLHVLRRALVQGQPLEERDIWFVPGDRDSQGSPGLETASGFHR